MKNLVGEVELNELKKRCMNVVNIEFEPVARLINEVVERRAAEERYKWHNLEKNPDDMPDIKRYSEEFIEKNRKELIEEYNGILPVERYSGEQEFISTYLSIGVSKEQVIVTDMKGHYALDKVTLYESGALWSEVLEDEVKMWRYCDLSMEG